MYVIIKSDRKYRFAFGDPTLREVGFRLSQHPINNILACYIIPRLYRSNKICTSCRNVKRNHFCDDLPTRKVENISVNFIKILLGKLASNRESRERSGASGRREFASGMQRRDTARGSAIFRPLANSRSLVMHHVANDVENCIARANYKVAIG